MEMFPALLFVAGLVLGLATGFGYAFWRQRALSTMQDAFARLSADVLRQNTEQFLHLANETLSKQTQTGEKDLDGKKQLIDGTLVAMKAELDKVQTMMNTLEKDRHQKFGQLSDELKRAAQQTDKLQETANHLRAALANTKARGQWGERMAEDVLRMAGFIEGINYHKQKTLENAGGRPDYTFNLPHGQMVNMDVKFPFDSYLRYLEAGSDMERQAHKEQFLRDARDRVKELTKRGYIDAAGDTTLDYVLLFIPNEQVYAFLHEMDPNLLDEALKNKVILCSPITLYAVLAVIRQAMDNFRLERTAGEILRVLGDFRSQWGKFTEVMDKVGQRLDSAQKEFQTLATTRTRMLERQLDKIDELQHHEGEAQADTPLTRLAASNDKPV
ncbi:MAG: DNA recombination protein RmuC [Proteobacteria bacterium]|nr:DNA recombination protein RmuC [Pseudomonadota bacterium]